MDAAGPCTKKPPVPLFNALTGVIEEQCVIVRSDAGWKIVLTKEQYEAARRKGTEYAFTGKYHSCKEPGIHRCACCGTDLFSSAKKFESGTGWPGFSAPVFHLIIRTQPDPGDGKIRTVVLFTRYGAHLGHVFNGGPVPTVNRYCTNSKALSLHRVHDEITTPVKTSKDT